MGIFIKYLIFFFNFFSWMTGLVLMAVGRVVLVEYRNYYSHVDSKFVTVPVFIIAAGSLIAVIGFIGCYGVWKENYCMISTFTILLSIVFILEIAAGFVGIVYKNKVQKSVGNVLFNAALLYSDLDEEEKKWVDWGQQKFHCCGGWGPHDYVGNQTCSNGGVASCYPGNKCGDLFALYKTGCKENIVEFVKKQLMYIGPLAIGLAFIQVLGIIFGCGFLKIIKKDYEIL